METPPDASQLLERIQSAWQAWSDLLGKIDPTRMTQPGVAGDWSIKDVIAHITWHEGEMVGLIEAHALVGSELWNLPTDERNAAIYELVRDQPLDQVLAESAQVHQQLVETLPSLSDQDLTDPGGFPGMPPDWQPWLIIAQNTYEHYQDHMLDLEKWTSQNGSF
jgi:hypothetical protein